ncbi:hypothetical protein FGX00_00760 [Xylella fastidiosa subsp. multiplex]|nr:hypothetical protein [Xylella fastidiosa subsp. multiplex]
MQAGRQTPERGHRHRHRACLPRASTGFVPCPICSGRTDIDAHERGRPPTRYTAMTPTAESGRE